ncbi:MAG: molybdopterin converting factor subunit 1 [Pseudomonadota bacterium]|nr:molybdopterin converting factor subunit 1 [Pseudomonadota bacterium]
MAIKVRCFASLREQLGVDSREIESAGVTTVGDVWAQLTDEPPGANVLMAVNQEYTAADSPVRDGDEVAFFPPVTGG